MSELERIARYIELTGHKKVVNKARYGMNLSEFIEIGQMAKESPFDGISLAFDFGLAKGFRAGKAIAAKRMDKKAAAR